MSDLRKDPIVDQWVIIAERRSQRPGAFLNADSPQPQPASSAEVSVRDCPFCAGIESQTPPSVYEQRDDTGRWSVRIIPNKYPAVVHDAESAAGIANSSPALGVHEVVVESPDHATDLALLSAQQRTRVLTAWRDRLREHRRDGRWQAALVFKNAGREAGASLEHVHSQIVALPRVPERLERELQAAEMVHQRHGQCAFCRFVAGEREADQRVLIDRSGYVAVTAYAGRQPYETWILPTRHQAAYDEVGDACLAELSGVLAQLLQALRKVLPVHAYNLVLHTAPFDTRWDDRYHWHIEIIPRISGLAGFELGGGEFINLVSPERAAREIKRNLANSGEL